MKTITDMDLSPSPETISAVCGVSVRTARRWLKGEANIPNAARTLLRLHLTGRIMPDDWPHGWKFNSRGYLETGHKNAMNWQQIDWQFYSVHLWRAALRRLERLTGQKEFNADVIQLEFNKEQHRKNGC